MTPEERDAFLTNRPPEIRARILAKVAEYQALDPDERELRLRATELRWYLMPLLRELADQPRRAAGESAGRMCANWSDPARRVEHFAAAVAGGISGKRAHRSTISRRWTRATPRRRIPVARRARPSRRIGTRFPKPSGARSRGGSTSFLNSRRTKNKRRSTPCPKPNAQQMEKTLQAFDKLPPAQRAECVNAFAKFASMSAPEQAEFLKNAERWSAMSPAERQAWRDLVVNVPQWPPLPIGFVAPIPPARTPIPAWPRITIEMAISNFNFRRRRLISRRASDFVSSRFVPGPFLWRDDRAGVRVRAVDGHAARAGAKKSPAKPSPTSTLWMMVGTILGARAVYVATYWKRRICRPADLGNFHDPARRAGFLRRPHRRDHCGLDLSALEKTAVVENRRRARAQHRAGQRLRPHRLPAQRLLLRPRLRFAVGHQFSRGNHCNRRPIRVHPTEIYDALLNLGSVFFSRVAVPAQEIRRPDFCDLPAFATPSPVRSSNIFAAIIRRPPSFRPDARAARQRADFCRGPGAGGNSVARAASKRGLKDGEPKTEIRSSIASVSSLRFSSPGRRRLENLKSRCASRKKSAAKSSPPIPCRCIADSTSARPSRRPPNAPACRITSLTSAS